MRRGEKRGEGDRHANYKNLISQYYERDAQLSDVRAEVRAVTPEIDILEELNDFERKIDTLIKTYCPSHAASATTSRNST